MAACSPAQEQAAPGAVSVECALGPGSEFTDACFAERTSQYIVLRHPDGSFRRLQGNTLEAVDGADEAVMVNDAGIMEVSIGEDRYRLNIGAIDGE